jgi:hypothetical protein
VAVAQNQPVLHYISMLLDEVDPRNHTRVVADPHTLKEDHAEGDAVHTDLVPSQNVVAVNKRPSAPEPALAAY